MTATLRLSRSVGPDFGAVGGAGDLRAIVGALLTYGLIVAVLMLVVSATTWAIASSSGSWHTAQKAKLGCFVAHRRRDPHRRRARPGRTGCWTSAPHL